MTHTPVTLNLPDEIYQRAHQLAQLVSQELNDVLIEALTLSLPTLNTNLSPASNSIDSPLETLPDADLLALTELRMEPHQDQRLSELLDRQQAGLLSPTEKPELWALMQIYQVKLIQQSHALRIAVQRGLPGKYGSMKALPL